MSSSAPIKSIQFLNLTGHSHSKHSNNVDTKSNNINKIAEGSQNNNFTSYLQTYQLTTASNKHSAIADTSQVNLIAMQNQPEQGNQFPPVSSFVDSLPPFLPSAINAGLSKEEGFVEVPTEQIEGVLLSQDDVEQIVSPFLVTMSVDGKINSQQVVVGPVAGSGVKTASTGQLVAGLAETVQAGTGLSGANSSGFNSAEAESVKLNYQAMLSNHGEKAINATLSGKSTISEKLAKDSAKLTFSGEEFAHSEVSLKDKMKTGKAAEEMLRLSGKEGLFSELVSKDRFLKGNGLISLSADRPVNSLVDKMETVAASLAQNANLTDASKTQSFNSLVPLAGSIEPATAKLSPGVAQLTANSEFTQGLNLKRNFSTNLAHRVQWMFNQTLSSAEIMMDPPEMGPLSVKVQQINGETSIMFQATNSATKEALEEGMPKLKEMLEEMGVNLGQTTVSQQKSETDSEQQQDDSSEGVAMDEGDEMNNDTAQTFVSERIVDYYS